MLAVARDWKLNEQVLQFPKFGASCDDKTLSFHITYPAFYCESLRPVMSSGLFSRDDNNDETEMIRTIYAYSVTSTKLQNMLDLSDQTLFVGLGRDPLKKWRQIRDSSELRLFKRVHSHLGELLKRGGWLSQEHVLEVSNELVIVRRLHDKVGVALSEDPNRSSEPVFMAAADWTVLQEWHARLCNMLASDGYFMRHGLFDEDERQRLSLAHAGLGRQLQLATVSPDRNYIVKRDLYKTIKKWHAIMGVPLTFDRWIIKDLDLLNMDY
ncbi:MAG: hypothetical protein JW955_15725 [Sedimentisphaerales bacterium]|nr:hypothetical protein [Sedimentisphaerales bacterium]